MVADACELLAQDLADGGRGDAGLAQLRRAAQTMREIPVGQSVAADTIAEQVRSLIIDLLQVAGVEPTRPSPRSHCWAARAARSGSGG